MLRLLLLRHAKAERSKPGTRDHERELTDRGRSDAATIGSYLMHHALVPSLALVSSSARTRETWKHTAKAFPNTPPVRYEDDLYDAGPKRILRIVKDVEPEAMTLLVIGHNPGLHELANLLVAVRRCRGAPLARRGVPDRSPRRHRPLDRRLEPPVAARRPADPLRHPEIARRKNRLMPPI